MSKKKISYLVSAENPPSYGLGHEVYWERSVDPFSRAAIQAAFQAEGLNMGTKVFDEPQRSGWMAIEWAENPVGFVPDGYECWVDVMPEYHFTDEGPSGHRIAERALNSLENARWYQSHGYVLTKRIYSEAELIKLSRVPDCHAIIMHEDDVLEFSESLFAVNEDCIVSASINSKPLFVSPTYTPESNKRQPVLKGEFIAVMKRHGLKPKGTVSEFA